MTVSILRVCPSCGYPMPGRHASGCHTMPPTKPAADPFEDQIAWMLVGIERNYQSEGTNWGSRFEGERLEVVQARAVIRKVRQHFGFECPNCADTPASVADDDLRAELAEEAAVDAWRERRET